MMTTRRILFLLVVLLIAVCPCAAAEFQGTIVDADTRKPIPARVYIEDANGEWLFVESAAANGSALPYREEWVPMEQAVERHTTVSAHPFRIDLPPGRYEVTIERGKEYFPLKEELVIDSNPQQRTFALKRFANLAARGWYSGETHVHRRIQELPNVMLAEDLNVAFPVTFWTTDAFTAPHLKPSTLRRQGPSPFGPRIDHGTDVIAVDETHIMFPRNTEYEIFSIDGQRHVQGAVFILNHKTAYETGMPPVAPIANHAHAEGALLDLDKHSWPWSMMVVPIAKVDLYELSNNSVWRTNFGFRKSASFVPKYMNVEADERGMTERGWLDYGFENYYTLLNCGFRMQPTAGTASGVHPVPLGYSRVYVHTGDAFSADAWLDGLKNGRSFVTTGPMLLGTVNEKLPGEVFTHKEKGDHRFRLRIESLSEQPIDRIEIIVNGKLRRALHPKNRYSQTEAGGFAVVWNIEIPINESSWIAVRSFQIGEDNRTRFAHTAPWHIDVAGEPVRPRREETDYLTGRMEEEITRNKDILPDAALQEFRDALAIYQKIAERAVD